MKTLTDIRKILLDEKAYVVERYGVTAMGVFGSYVRNEQRPDSDVDILIELEQPPHIDLLDLVGLEHYLSERLGVKVDLALKSSLRRRIGQRILDEVVLL